MRILGAGDLHGDLGLAIKLSQKAVDERVDLVLLCGDITDDNSAENILAPFKEKNLKMLIISGNHESISAADFLAYINNARHLHGYSVKYDDIGIFGCGSANVGIHGISEKEIFDTLKRGNNYLNDVKKKIMMTHVHPAGSKMEMLSNFVQGSTGIRKAIDEFKPDILICSHVHEAEGLEEQIGTTLVINVGTIGKIIDL
ncbi:MAG: metallophosphoesterase family protein [Candidatus Nanoarchaeia archaeon]